MQESASVSCVHVDDYLLIPEIIFDCFQLFYVLLTYLPDCLPPYRRANTAPRFRLMASSRSKWLIPANQKLFVSQMPKHHKERHGPIKKSFYIPRTTSSPEENRNALMAGSCHRPAVASPLRSR
jgi:hypothetical protein